MTNDFHLLKSILYICPVGLKAGHSFSFFPGVERPMEDEFGPNHGRTDEVLLGLGGSHDQ